MATPIDFAERNDVLRAPAGSKDNCTDLYIHRNHDPALRVEYPLDDGTIMKGHMPIVISVWELSNEELIHIAHSGRIYFQAWGHTHPPIYISGLSFFGKPNTEGQ